MSPANRSSDGNYLLISLASTMVVGYLSTRFKLFRALWRFLPLLVVVSAWFINRQVGGESTTVGATVTEPKAKASP